MPVEAFLDHGSKVAPTLSGQPGLWRKLWAVDPENDAALGLYVFEDEAALQRFVDGPILAALKQLPIRDLRITRLLGLRELSRQTRAALFLQPEPQQPTRSAS
jgi:hypothetical protein